MSSSGGLILRQVARVPLIHAMAVLWLSAVIQLGLRLPEGALHLKWPVGAVAAALTLLLLLGMFRQLQFAAVSMLIGLAAALTLSRQLGVGSAAGAGTVAVAYALLLWLLATLTLSSPASHALARLLRLTGGHGLPGGRAILDASVHRGGYAVCIVVLGLTAVAALVPIGEWRAAGQAASWPMLAIAGAFFVLAGWRYHNAAHSYPFLISVLFGVWLLCAEVVAPGERFERALVTPAIGLWTVLLSIASSAVAVAIDRGGEGELVARARYLYCEPLRRFAVALALGVIVHQVVLSTLAVVSGQDPSGALIVLLAGVALLFANHDRGHLPCSVLGVLVTWLALYVMAMDMLLPQWRAMGHGDGAHHGFVLAALALLVSGMGSVLLAARGTGSRVDTALAGRYAGPLLLNGALAFVVAVLISGATLLGSRSGDPFLARALLAAAMALLMAATLPVFAPLATAGRWRGVLVPVLMSGLVASLLAVPEMSLAGAGRTAFGWGFALWLCGNLVVGRWNRRLPRWLVDEWFWPWFGLALVLAGSATLISDPATVWLGLAGLSLYAFMLIRNSDGAVLPWLGAATLTASGLALSGWWMEPVAHGRWQPLSAVASFVSVVWLNVLLGGIALWRRHGPALAAWLSWRRTDLEIPLLVCSGFALLVTLGMLVAIQSAWMLAAPLPFTSPATPGSIGLALALAASFVHANRVYPGAVFAHAFLLSLLCAVLSALMLFQDLRHLPLAAALWGVTLLLTWRLRARNSKAGPFMRSIDAALSAWVYAVPAVAVVLAVLVPLVSTPERLIVLAIVLAHLAGIGWWRQQRRWLAAAVALGIVLQHALWLLWLPPGQLYLALPWYALIGAVNVLLVLWLCARLGDGLARDPEGLAPHHSATSALLAVLSWFVPVLAGLMALELLVHFAWVAGAAAIMAGSGGTPRWLSGVDPIAALAGWAVLVGLSVRTAHRRVQGRWIYAAAMLGIMAAFYLRVVNFGLAPPGPVDTAVLIGAAYVLFAVQRVTLSTPTLHVCLALPLLAVATLPAQLGSLHAGSALMAIAVLYLLIRGRTLNPVPLYLGVLALNASVYLWIPLWADRLGMFQLYVMPAAVSVLVLLHLHRRELRSSVLNGARLTALTALYCGAALDVFAHPGLAMFALALAFSMASVIVGIAFRIRAFMYAGVVFLVLSVGYQLVNLYPEQRLGRAILLIVLGIAITGAMIGFNMKREAIMQRIRIFRADLETWD